MNSGRETIRQATIIVVLASATLQIVVGIMYPSHGEVVRVSRFVGW